MHRRMNGTCILGQRFRIFPAKIFMMISMVFLVYYFLNWKSSIQLSVSVKTDHELRKMKSEILHLSGKYVKDLANKLFLVKDGPAAYPDTAYDMKKALAVLIDDLNSRVNSLNERITFLEQQANVSTMNGKNRVHHDGEMDEFVGVVDLIQSKQDVCPFPNFEEWPQCQRKIEWMREMWESDSCYADWGVDGTDCTIYMYLSEQEQWCPPFPSRVNRTLDAKFQSLSIMAEFRTDFEDLFQQMGREIHFAWIKSRILRMSSKWIQAGQRVEQKYHLFNREKKKILIHMGLLSDDNGWNIAKNAFTGGPLGELVQWSDLISAVYILGHDVILTKSLKDLKNIYEPYLRSASSNCPLKDKPFDILYSDITGLRMLKKVAGAKFHLLQCNVRVLDSFGTEPEFNHPNYASKKLHKTSWGKWNINPKQFNTMFPHSPDNTFLGFVVEEHRNDTTIADIEKEKIALVYGKRDLFWKGSQDYISAIHEVMEVHATIDKQAAHEYVPDYVINHGILPGFELHQLLRRSKVFIGLGFPYEGPAPLEAIVNGAVFINPVFKEPRNSENTEFFKGKPTLRKLTSQHPYAEMYIGEPHVRSVDIDDLQGVKNTLLDILNGEQVKPYMPYEFTCDGMLERLSFYLDKQDFCSGSIAAAWPPQSSLQVKITDHVQTCSEVCHANGLFCEPAFFPILNKRAKFEELGIHCANFHPTVPQTEIDYPAFLRDSCFLQSDPMLFSCAGRYTDMQRICPCRDYLQGQVALCKSCIAT